MWSDEPKKHLQGAFLPLGQPQNPQFRLLLWLRWGWLTAWSITLMVSAWANPALDWTPCLQPFVVGVFIAGLSLLRYRTQGDIGRDELFVQLLIDLMLLTWLLVLSGGNSNPWVTFYLLPLALAAWMLSLAQLLFLLALVLVAYTALMTLDVSTQEAAWPWQSYQGHLLGMWLNFVVSSVLLVGCLAMLRRWLHAQETQLKAWQRHAALRDQAGAISTLAASSVHELATPINTLTLLVDEIPDSVACKADIHDISERASQILLSLREQARHPEHMPSQPTQSILEALLSPYRERFPDVQWSLDCSDASLPIQLPWSLQLLISHLLRNAQESGARQVRLRSWRQEGLWCGAIEDDGPGFSADVLAWFNAGSVQPWQSEKADGFGMGLLLAATTLADLQGELHIANADGAQVTWRLPLRMLEG